MTTDVEGVFAAAHNVSIETFVRLKPTDIDDLVAIDHADYLFNNGNQSGKRAVLHVQVPESADQGLLLNHATGKLSFEYDKVFDVDATNQLIFNEVVADKVLDAFNGISSTIFAYGQTGSGKSYTMTGGNTFNERGIIPFTIERIFDEIKTRQMEGVYSIQCQMTYTEIYKEAIYDLLDFTKPNHGNNAESNSPVQILEDETGNMLLNNVNVYDITSEEDALKLFFLGNNNRIVASTAMNAVSSRSHAILTLVLSSQMVNKNNQTICMNSKINLVDLAGSERMYKMQNSASQIKEAKSINLSLHYLEQVVVSLRDRAKSNARSTHIPYRNSVLTSLLRDSLGGNSKASFVVTLSIEKINFEETISSLRFGQRCGEIKVDIVPSTELSAQDQIYLLEDKVKSLQHQLARAEEKLSALSCGLIVDEFQVAGAIPASVSSSKVISAEEKVACKQRVNELISAVKSALELEIQGMRVLPNGDEILDRLNVRAAEVMIFDAQQDFSKECESMEEYILLETAEVLSRRLMAVTLENERANRLASTSSVFVDTNTHNENYINVKPNLVRSSSTSGSLKILTRSSSFNQAASSNSGSPGSLQRSNSANPGSLQRSNSATPGSLQRSNSSSGKFSGEGSPGSLQRQNSGSPGSLQRQSSNRGRVKRTLDPFHVSSEDLKMLLSGAIFIKYGRFGSRSKRFVCVTPDLSHLIQRHADTTSEYVPYSSYTLQNYSQVQIADLESFTDVENTDKSQLKSQASAGRALSKRSCVLMLIGKTRKVRTLYLEYNQFDTILENHENAIKWANALTSAIASAARGSFIHRSASKKE